MRDYWEQPEKKKINVKKIVISILISIIIIAIIVLVALYVSNEQFRDWTDIQIFRKEISQDRVAVIELEEGQFSNVYAFNRYIGILNKNKLSLYGSTGSEEASLDIEISTPVFFSSNRFLVVGEQNGQKMYLIEDKEIAWESEIEGNISQVYVNKNGYVAVIISGTSYKSVVQVFDPEGNALFKRFLSSTIAMDVSISNDNKYLAIADVDTSGTIVQSHIRVISIEEARTDPSNSEENNYQSGQNKLIIDIEYQDKNRIVCMYTDTISIIENGQETTMFDNEDKKIVAQSVKLNNNFVTIEEESAGIFSANSVVNIVDIDTKNTKNYTLESSIKEIYTKGDIIVLNLGREVEIINTGEMVEKVLEKYLLENNLENDKTNKSEVNIYLTDIECNFLNEAKKLLENEEISIKKLQ